MTQYDGQPVNTSLRHTYKGKTEMRNNFLPHPDNSAAGEASGLSPPFVTKFLTCTPLQAGTMFGRQLCKIY